MKLKLLHFIFSICTGFLLITNLSFSQWSQTSNGIISLTGDVYCFTSSGTSIFVGFAGGHGVYRSTDDGDNWQAVNTGIDNMNIYSLTSSGSYIFAGANSGSKIYVSSNNGSNWILSNSGIAVSNSVTDIKANGNTIFACINGGGVYASTNNGASWIVRNTGLTNLSVQRMLVKNNKIYVCTNPTPAGVFMTTNNGSNWQNITYTLPVSGFIFTLGSVSNNVFATVAGTTGGFDGIYRNTNDTTTWQKVSSIDPLSFATTGKYIFGGSSVTGVSLSKNNGTNWDTVNSGFTALEVESIFILNKYIYAGIWNNGVWRRPLSEMIDTVSQTYHNYNINKILIANQNVYDTINVNIYKSNILGNVFDLTVYIDTVVFTPVNNLEFALIHEGITDTIIYRVGGTGSNFINTALSDSAAMPINSGSPPFTGNYKPYRPLSQFNSTDANGLWVLRVYNNSTLDNPFLTGVIKSWGMTITYNATSGVKQISSIVPDKYILYQNYPNPFNPSTKIRFSVPLWRGEGGKNTSLKIFDILGREVSTLVNENLKPGTYEVNFDGSLLPSGIYFYKITVVDPLRRPGDFSDVKRMIIIK